MAVAASSLDEGSAGNAARMALALRRACAPTTAVVRTLSPRGRVAEVARSSWFGSGSPVSIAQVGRLSVDHSRARSSPAWARSSATVQTCVPSRPGSSPRTPAHGHRRRRTGGSGRVAPCERWTVVA